MNNWFNKNGIHLAIIAIFVVITFAYFSPVLQGKAPAQSDVIQSQAMQKEIMDFKEKDGKAPLWTNQMFGGMPAYQIWVPYAYNGATYGIALITKALPNPTGTVLLLLFGAYFLFIVLKVNPWLAAAGAIAFTFTTYNFVLIASGHSSKALAIGFFAPIIASILLTIRGKYWYGASLTALFLALEIRTNHVQMTYYLLLAILVFVLVELYQAYRNKTISNLIKSFGFLALSVVLAIMINASLLWSTAEYAKETNRGKSNLTAETSSDKDSGMSKEYAYQWSQGVGESFTFLIPDLYGGASGVEELVKPDGNMYKAVAEITGGDQAQTTQAIQQLGQQLNMQQYWGEKPFTQGGYYFGAIICFLFVFGLFIVRNPLKWWILSTTILFILLSFGRHFPLVSNFFFDYFPLYNKFRAVESILAVVGLMVPILALLAVKEVQDGNIDQKVLVKKLTWSAGITGGFALIVAIAPTLFFSFQASNHAQIVQALTQSLQNNAGVAQKIANGLVEDRIAIGRGDAFRSFLFILIGFGIIWAFITKKLNAQLAFGLLALAILVDMWQVDRRYLNNKNFEPKTTVSNYFQPRDVDNFISADKDPNFRVFDASINTFNDASTSSFHKTVGGYHAAKLKRFDELIQHQFTKSINQDVLDMLNTKYIITQDQKTGSYKMQRNPTAAGNAWFVESIQFVKNSDEEMKAISSFDARKEAIVDESFKGLVDSKILGTGQEGFIKLTNYNPDHLTYEYSTAKEVVAVFSEIYYNKGWKMYIDGVEKPYFRADYVLRAAKLEAGNHKLEFIFHPTSYYAGENISLAGSILLLAALGFGIYAENKKKSIEVKA
ncbi:membrane protein YfhO [Pedobacter psychrotolerans]|uniref:Membrane protein n=1 Tax=Pedobacter psychrotolerans TaxID=1843235 RepID=A0A4R2HGI3_9SPHI|nr:YfhO family protein [Pedobacter psychrotolerans]TCO27184.1 membrane protein YfhO [Pedobacter psychrotolerans]GGE59573.1 membrane protein [Pedobacter psychrotolerans]